MASDTRSGRKIKVDDNNSKRRHIGVKEPTALGSSTTDTYSLRSARETPTKEQAVLSPSSTRKSERLEKQTPTIHSVKTKSERVEKQGMLSPLRRSKKAEKCLSLSSSGSKKSDKGFSSLNTKRKKEKRDKNGKQARLDARESSRHEKQDQESAHVVRNKKRLDARSYRALLNTRAKKAKESDLSEEMKVWDKLSQRDSDNSAASGLKKVVEGGYECNERKGEEWREEDLGRVCERDLEGSNSDLGKFAEGTSRNHREVESSQFSQKRKDRPEEALESENGDSSQQPYPHGVMAKETVDDAEMMQVDCSAREDLQTLALIEPISEGRPLAGNVILGRFDKVRAFGRDCDASLTVASKGICISHAEAVLSSPSGNKGNNFSESCVACSKRQRVDFDSQNWELCSCNTKAHLVEHSQLSISVEVQDGGGLSDEVWNSLQQVEVPSLQSLDAVPSDQSNHDTLALQSVSQFQLPQSTDLPSAEHNQPDVPAHTGTQHWSTNEVHSSVRQAQVLTLPPVDASAELSNHSIEQPVTHLPLHPPIDIPIDGYETHVSDLRSMSTIPGFSNGLVQTVPVMSWMPQPLYSDPLQNEMERTHKEKEQAIKIHEDTKLRLKSECDKEIEETVTQIQRKYDALQKNAEAALVQTRKALETNYNTVYMNKMLAEAFRSKCRDPRGDKAPGPQQAVPSSFMHQLLQQSLQQPAFRPASVTGPQMTFPPMAPPVQVVHHSSALFSSNPVRPPFSSIVPPTGNLQVGSEVQAPAPHLQVFRPAMSISVPNFPHLPSGMRNQHSPSNPPAISSMIPQHSPRLPTYASGPYSMTHPPESAGGTPVPKNPFPSVLELLMDVDNHRGAIPPNLLPPLQDWGPDF
ncbi:hypothetical protein HHK36_011175 [Tetracentron sinense]|uniref:Uncharacterized protein n=1 Tax=Tetracentron sinense TaxID=13715 RepID=A0A835DH36_TETSI|nr:hypothetical protein HHK36_011175 [Tetracentron sinense]